MFVLLELSESQTESYGYELEPWYPRYPKTAA